VITDNHHFAFGQASVTHVDIDCLTYQAIELNDGARGQCENFLDAEGGSTKLDGHWQHHVEE
jgi:hypothetical protein